VWKCAVGGRERERVGGLESGGSGGETKGKRERREEKGEREGRGYIK
jgi:hypothetical protein